MNYAQIIQSQQQFFLSQQTKSKAARIQHLQRFRQMLSENETEIYQAIHADFHKSEHEAFLTEVAILYKDIDEACAQLGRWMKPQKVGTNLLNFPGSSQIIPEPLGVCLVIGAWNYPIQLSFAPAIAALAAGNTLVLKPSELAANSAACMASLVAKYFDPQIFTVVLGGVAETTQLLAQRFDKIFFTGSPAVGKIVYQAAAQHLTPVTLELGGKSPAVLTPSAALPTAIKRLVWAKFLNAGQTCIAPDYLFVHSSIYLQCLDLLGQEIKKNQYALENHNYVQIINERNLERLSKLIDPNKIVYGGQIDQNTRTIAPTILKDITTTEPIMQQEIFGPLLPVLPYSDFNEVLHYISHNEKPLSAYLFSNNKTEQTRWTKQLSFGGGCINDAIMHITNPHLPFGGVGNSGMGAYHGKAGFDCFSHQKSIFKKPILLEAPLKYPPYSAGKLKWIKRLLKLS
jgi:aldehyde dehydrogenase (NAD+)